MKSSFLKRKPADQDMALQITSMADIFMILLVFLLKSYSSSVSTISASSGVQLPTAQSETSAKETLKLEISEKAILVDEKPIVTLKNFEFDPKEVPPPGTGRSESLYRVLVEQRKHMPVPNMDSNLLVFADQNAPYATLQSVLASAASSGFVDLQLVVVKEE
jgi:biopolymer transport protein ExbD